MKRILFFVVIITVVSVGCVLNAFSQVQGEDGAQLLITQALRSNGKLHLPKKIKTHGNPKAARWEDVDTVLASLANRVDAKQLVGQLRDFHQKQSVSDRAEVLDAAVEKSLAAHVIRFQDLFTLDDAALFPLTNSVLKYVPDASLVDVPVYDKKGKQLGKFSSKYTYERSGGLTGRQSYQLVFFQYLDENAKSQTTGADLLLDSYAVRWGDIKDRPGFNLAVFKERNP